MREIAVGIVGCGRGSENHLRVFSKTKGVKLVAVCDVDSVKSKAMAQRYGASHALTDFNSLLELDLDLVDIVTPPKTHSMLSMRALETGHNVLVEKPMATSSNECLQMINAAKKSGRTLCVNHNKLFFNSIAKTKSVLERENLPITRMRVTQLFHSSEAPKWILTEESGGILWEAAVHHVYLIQHFLGNIQSVYAMGNKIKQPVYDSITLVLKSGDETGICELEWNTKESLMKYQLVTKNGDRFDGDLKHDFVIRKSKTYKNIRTTIFRSFSDDFYEPWVKWSGNLKNLLEMRTYETSFPYRKTFFSLIKQLVLFINGKRAEPPVTAEKGLQTIKILEAAKKSIETGKVQSITL